MNIDQPYYCYDTDILDWMDINVSECKISSCYKRGSDCICISVILVNYHEFLFVVESGSIKLKNFFFFLEK